MYSSGPFDGSDSHLPSDRETALTMDVECMANIEREVADLLGIARMNVLIFGNSHHVINFKVTWPVASDSDSDSGSISGSDSGSCQDLRHIPPFSGCSSCSLQGPSHRLSAI